MKSSRLGVGSLIRGQASDGLRTVSGDLRFFMHFPDSSPNTRVMQHWLTDLELLAALKRGEEKAFDQLFRQYFAGMSWYAFTIVKDRQQAEDLVQDCLESLWKRRSRMPDLRSVKAYLYKTVFFTCCKYLERKIKMVPNGEEFSAASVLDKITAAETARMLYELLAKLPASQQQVARLYYLEEKTPAEIAQILQITPDAVRKQRVRALISLRKAIIPLS